VITTCLVTLAMTVTVHRDNGLLKRMRGTPLPVAAFVVGVVVSSLVTAVLLVALTSVMGRVLYQAPWPAHPLPLVVTVILGGSVFCAIGLALTVLIPNSDAAPAIVNICYLPLVFISGFFFSFSNTVVSDIAKVFPIVGFKEMMLIAYGAKPSATGWDVHDLPVLLLWGAGALFVTLRWFRWEPHRA
jgi:ABC-2 type transport system permease protein